MKSANNGDVTTGSARPIDASASLLRGGFRKYLNFGMGWSCTIYWTNLILMESTKHDTPFTSNVNRTQFYLKPHILHFNIIYRNKGKLQSGLQLLVDMFVCMVNSQRFMLGLLQVWFVWGDHRFNMCDMLAALSSISRLLDFREVNTLTAPHRNYELYKSNSRSLGAFAKLQNVTINFKFACPSVHPHSTTRLQLDVFWWNFIFERF
jgi:hypothetical protein